MARADVIHLDGAWFSLQPLQSRWWLFAVGILLIVAGISVLALPFCAKLAVEVVIGWAFVIAGVFELLDVFRAKAWSEFAWQVLIGAVVRHSRTSRGQSSRWAPGDAERPGSLRRPSSARGGP